MLRLAKYLKPYWIWILISLGLLFLQANLDLALPDYMSRIVNVGIQQGGLEKIQPEALSQDHMEKLPLLLGAQGKDELFASYKLVQPGQDPSLEQKYSLLKSKPVYVLQDGAPGLSAEAELELARALIFAGNADKIPAAALADPAALSVLKSQAETKLAALDASTIKQVAMVSLRAEYESLGMDMAAYQTHYILVVGLQMLLLTLLSALCVIFVGLIAARTGAGLARDLRKDVFTRVENFSLVEFDTFSTASLITRCTNDINQIQMLVIMFIRMVIYAPIMGIGGVFRAVNKAPSMAWLIAVAVVVLLVMIVVIFVVAMPRFRIIQKLVDRLNLVTRENLGGLMVVRAFNRQDFEEQRFDKANKDLTEVNLFVMRTMSLMMPAVMLIMNLLSVAIIWVGAHAIASSSMQVGDMMAFLQYAMQIVMSFMMMSMIFIMLPRAAVSGDRIADVLGTEPSIRDPEVPVELKTPVRGEIEFRKVNFRYPGGEEDALRDISFTAQPGKTTAIIGSTGSGKSTLVGLVTRLYDVSGGQVLLDGQDIRSLRQEDLRGQIGYVPQKNTLFTGTIKSNIAFGKPGASDSELLDAVETAQAAEFLEGRDEGMDSPISQGGTNVSGGQKQRLSIARALATKAPVLIFDDSFSALDFKTDAALRRSLAAKTGSSTLIIVAQRVSTIMNAHQILVLDDGQIVGRGTHKELMETCEAYREIAQSQLGSEDDR